MIPNHNMRKGLVAVCLLALLQCALRFAIPAMTMLGSGPEFEHPVSGEAHAFIVWMFVLQGAVGIATTYGLWKMRKWGFDGTIYLSLVTIAFDAWAALAIQPTALLGLVLPVMFIVYLLMIRSDMRGSGLTRGVRA